MLILFLFLCNAIQYWPLTSVTLCANPLKNTQALLCAAPNVILKDTAFLTEISQ